MKLLHLASFNGNVGDVLSNHGLQAFLNREYRGRVDQEKLEIRSFYKNTPADRRLSLDDVLVEASSRFDRILIGGGGFLDYWVPDSSSGATIDISESTLESLGRKVVISSVGAYPIREVPSGNIEKFSAFLSMLKSSNNVDLMFRNDGSVEHLSRVLGAEATTGLRIGGDHCYLLDEASFLDTRDSRPYIAVNIAPDQLEMQSNGQCLVDKNNFYKTVARALIEISETHSSDIVFVPHLLEDYKACLELTSLMPDAFVRSRFKTVRYSGTAENVFPIVSVYRHSIANIVMRLHANILSLMLDKRTISLGVLNRVAKIANQHRESVLIDNFEGDFSEPMIHAANRPETKKDAVSDRIRCRVEDFLRQALG